MVEIKARVTYQGEARHPALVIQIADRDRYFKKAHSTVVIEVDGKRGYAMLQPSFYADIPQIRTIYEEPKRCAVNLLRKWIARHNVKLRDRVRLEVIERYDSFRLKV